MPTGKGYGQKMTSKAVRSKQRSTGNMGNPPNSSPGQDKGSGRYRGNPAGGGAAGQPMGSNRTMKPRMGTQGQQKAG